MHKGRFKHNKRRQAAEDELKRSEGYLRAIFDGSRDAIFVVDIETNTILDANEQALRLTERPREDIVGQDRAILHPANEEKQHNWQVHRHTAASRAGPEESEVVTAGGRRVPVAINASTVTLPDKRRVIIGVFRDITERKRTEELRRKSEEEKKLILSLLQDLVVYQDTENKILWANESTARAFGKTVEQLLGEKCYKIFHGRGSPCEGCPVVRAVKTKRYEESEMTTPDGRSWIIKGSAVKNENGDVTGVLEVAIDITDRKRAEEVLKRDKGSLEKIVKERTAELIKAQKHLEDAKRLADIGQLAATVAHELRNPLGAMKIASYNIRKKRKVTEIDSHLDTIEKKVSESDQIIQNLLFYARMKAPRFERAAVIGILDTCIGHCHDKYAGWDVEVKKVFEPKEGDFTIDVDPLQISEMFANILDNAYQAFPEKRGVVEVGLGYDKQNDLLNISFSDNGIGIKKEELPKVFEPFFTSRTKGVGLGLTVCKQVVDLHGGTIDITSEGKGTTVSVKLPVHASS